MKILFALIMLFSINSFAQEEEGPRRDSGGWEYNGVFKFSDKLKIEDGDWSLTAIDILASYGPRYHRYDPIRKSDMQAISAFTKQSYYASIGIEYRFYKYLSIIANWAWEDQEVERYDGIVVEHDNPYSRENFIGGQFNYDPLFIAYEVGEQRVPHYYLDSGDFYARRYVDLDISTFRLGFRRKITETYSLSFSADYTQAKDFVDPVFGNATSETVGVNMLILHKSGFGIRIREEEGEIDSDAHKYKTKAFGIMPFMSLL